MPVIEFSEEEGREDMQRALSLDRAVVAAAQQDAEEDAHRMAASQSGDPLDYAYYLLTAPDRVHFGEAVTSSEPYLSAYQSAYEDEYEVWAAAYAIAVQLRELNRAIVEMDASDGTGDVLDDSAASGAPVAPRRRTSGAGAEGSGGGDGSGDAASAGASRLVPRSGRTLPGIGPSPDDPALRRTLPDPRTRRTFPGVGTDPMPSAPVAEPGTSVSGARVAPITEDMRTRVLRMERDGGGFVGTYRANPTESAVYESLWQEAGGVGPPPPHGFVVLNPDGTRRGVVMDFSSSPGGTRTLHAPFH
jgi:hypothetical protein